MATIKYTELGVGVSSTTFGAETTDFCFYRAVRRQSDGKVLVGGQTMFAALDRKMWVYSRAYEFHEGANYEGYWGYPNTILFTRSTAQNLSITEASGYEGNDEKARVPVGTTLHATWGVRTPEDTGLAVNWRWKLVNATTAAVVNTGLVSGSGDFNVNIGALGNGSYLLWVAPEGVYMPYRWPSDFSSYSGESSTTRYEWKHPVLGTLLFHPAYSIGALPYRGADQAGDALLDQYEENRRLGALRKNKSWVDYLISFDEDGNQMPSGGEWACLKIIAGVGSWVGDANCNIEATPGPCVWEAENGDLTPVMVEPRLRSVGSFLEESDGSFWLGGMIAGRSGRAVTVIRVLPDFSEDYGYTGIYTRYCECAESAEQVVSLVRFRGVIHALTYCELFKLDETAPPKERLVGSNPGGRSLTVRKTKDGKERLCFAVESDFATSKQFGAGFNYIIEQEGSTRRVGPPTAHQYNDILAVYGSRLWAITVDKNYFGAGKTEEAANDSNQYLSWYNEGSWAPVHNWKVAQGDYGRLVRVGASLMAFGFDRFKSPVSMVLTGESLSTSIPLDYLVLEAQSTRSADGERGTAMLVARKMGNDGSYDDNWHLVEVDANASDDDNPDRVCFSWDVGEQSYCVEQAQAEAAGFGEHNLPAFLVWDEGAFIWRPASALHAVLPSLQRQSPGSEFCYHKPDGVTMPYNPVIWGELCLELGSSDTLCFLSEDLVANGLNPNSMPNYLIWNGVSWLPSNNAPVNGETHYERSMGPLSVCYRFHLGDNGGGGNGLCHDNAAIAALGMEPGDLPPYLVWDGESYKPGRTKPAIGTAYLERVIGVGQTCFREPGDEGEFCILPEQLEDLLMDGSELPARLVWNGASYEAADWAPSNGIPYLVRSGGLTHTFSGAGVVGYNGTYRLSGSYNGANAYTNGAKWLWFMTGGGTWRLSPAKGNYTPESYYSEDGDASSVPTTGWETLAGWGGGAAPSLASVLEPVCYAAPEDTSGEFCFFAASISANVLSALPEYLVLTNGTWRASNSLPQVGATYLVKNVSGGVVCYLPPGGPAPGPGHCVHVNQLRLVSITAEDMPLFIVWNGDTWQPSNERPQDGSIYLEREIGPEMVCYRLPNGPDCNTCPWGRGGFCLSNTVLAGESLDPETMPDYIVLEEGVWSPTNLAPDGTQTYFYKVVGEEDVCYRLHDSGGDNGGFCLDNEVLAALGLGPDHLPPYLAWNGSSYEAAYVEPDAGTAYLERAIGVDDTCYRAVDEDGFCLLDDDIEGAGLDPDDLPDYLVWDGSVWQAADSAPANGFPYKVKDETGDTTCYRYPDNGDDDNCILNSSVGGGGPTTLTPFKYWNGTAWVDTGTRPGEGVVYLERVIGPAYTCYRPKPPSNPGNEPQLCVLNSVLSGLGITPSSLPLYILLDGGDWAATNVAPGEGGTYLVRRLGSDRVCYELHNGDTDNPAFCFDLVVLGLLGLSGGDLPPYLALVDGHWVFSATEPGNGVPYKVRTVGVSGVCYEDPESNQFCLLADQLKASGLDPNNLPLYLSWDGTGWVPSNFPPSPGLPYIERVVTGDLACYRTVFGDSDGFCVLNSVLAAQDPALVPTELPNYLVWNEGDSIWEAQDNVPEDGVRYMRRVDGDVSTCYEEPGVNHGPGHCTDNSALSALGLVPTDLPPYLIYEDGAWLSSEAPPEVDGTLYLVRSVGLTATCYRVPDALNGECTPLSLLASFGLTGADMPPYKVLSGVNWVPSMTRPTSGPFLERTVGDTQVCYRPGVPNDVCVGCLKCQLNSTLASLGLTTSVLPDYLVWDGVAWVPADSPPLDEATPWMELVIGSYQSCYRPHQGGDPPFGCVSLVSLAAIGVPPSSLPLYKVWDGLVFVPTNDLPVFGIAYLVREISAIAVCYVSPGPGGRPVDPCANARCVLEKLTGVRVGVLRWPGQGEEVLAPISSVFYSDTTDHDGFGEFCRTTPSLWLRTGGGALPAAGPGEVLSEEDLVVLESFKTRLLYGMETWLPEPTEEAVEVLVILPSGRYATPFLIGTD